MAYDAIKHKPLYLLKYCAEGSEIHRVCIEYHTDHPYQILCFHTTRWRYTGRKRVLACKFHILSRIFMNFISTGSLDRDGSSDIGHAHFRRKLLFLGHYRSKTYFFELLLGFTLYVHETLHTQSPDRRDQMLSKEFCYVKKYDRYK